MSPSNEPLGLIDVKHFDYDEYDLTRDRHERPIEEKHTPRDVSKERYQPIKVNVVMAYNSEYCWIVLTNLPIETVEQKKEVVNIYLPIRLSHKFCFVMNCYI